MEKLHVLVAVDIRSSHNIGSLFRTCDGFGARLFLVGICPLPAHEKDVRLPHIASKTDSRIAKTALGAEKTVYWKHFRTLEECIVALRKDGYKVIALEQTTNSRLINELDGSSPVALVVGREVEGLSKEELELCDEVYEIPMKGSKESFNVSVAAGVGLYQLVAVS